MRIRTTEQQFKEVEVVKENYLECDKCRNKIKTKPFDGFSCELSVVTGDVYPEGNYTEEKTLDLCQECSDDLLILLQSSGYRINTIENDY